MAVPVSGSRAVRGRNQWRNMDVENVGVGRANARFWDRLG